MTQLQTTHLSEGSIKTLHSDNVVLKFRDFSQCINDLFWTIHHNLSNDKKCIVVIDNDESFKHINYLLSKNGVKDITLLIGSNEDHIDSYSYENLTQQLPTSDQSFAESAQHNLEVSLTELERRIDFLKTPKLGKLSISQLHDRLKARQKNIKQSKLDLNVYELINFDAFRKVKAQILEAENQYDYKFKYTDRTSPFSPEVLVKKSSVDLQMILNDFLDDARKILSDFYDIKHLVQSQFIQFQNKTTEKLNAEFLNLASNIRLDGPAYSLTEEKKIAFYLSGLSTQLGFEIDSSLDINNQYIVCRGQYDQVLNSIHIETTNKIENTLQTLTTQNSYFTQLGELMTRSEEMQKEFEVLQIIKSYKAKRSLGFSFSLASLEQFIEELEYAQNFIEIESGYIQWMNYMHNLEDTTQKVVYRLAQQNGSWLDTFEIWYLNGFMDTHLPKIKSAEEMVQKVAKDLSALEQVLSDVIKSKSEGQIENIRNNQTWLDLFVEQSDKVAQRFPLLLCRPAFFEKHKDVLIDSYSDVLFLETKSDTFLSGFETRYFTTNDGLQQSVVKNNNASLCQVGEVYFTVNRSLENLSIHELSRCTLHLGQQMKNQADTLRIFLVKNKTLISFLSPSNNSMLLESFREHGIKEIYSNDEQVNLLPGIISDLASEKIILLQEGLLNPHSSDSLLEQVQLLDKIMFSGLNILSLDTYKLITNDTYNFENLTEKILKNKSHNIALLNTH